MTAGPSTCPPFERVPVTYAFARNPALDEVRWDDLRGRADWRDVSDSRICRVIARGRIVARLAEGIGRDPICAFVIAHPDLPDDEHYVVFRGDAPMRLYRGTADAARAVLASGAAYNW